MQTVSAVTRAIALDLACSTTAVVAENVWLDRDTVTYKKYDGITDDLLSAGLNQAGLISTTPPPLSAEPTEAELRRRAIYNNYRAIVDWVPGGGMGVFWGPQSPQAPVIPGATPGLIPGWEYKGYLRVTSDAGHVNNVPAAVQIPKHFDPKKPCIVAAMPSGSRSL